MNDIPTEKTYITKVIYDDMGVHVILSNGAELLGIKGSVSSVSTEDPSEITLSAYVLPQAIAEEQILLS